MSNAPKTAVGDQAQMNVFPATTTSLMTIVSTIAPPPFKRTEFFPTTRAAGLAKSATRSAEMVATESKRATVGIARVSRMDHTAFQSVQATNTTTTGAAKNATRAVSMVALGPQTSLAKAAATHVEKP